MNIFKIILIISFFFTSFCNGQDGQDLFDLIQDRQEVQLLPERMVFTQRLLWGDKGFLRKIGIAPLNTIQREKELKLRRSMLTSHQVIGYATLAAMVAQGIIGAKLHKNWSRNTYDLHKDMATVVNIGYFTGAGLSLFAPPPLINKKVKGFSSIKAHKTLATIHFSAMVLTNVVDKYKNNNIHRASAYTAFGSYAVAILVFKF